MPYEHVPVLLKEVLENLQIKSGGHYIDGTLGGASYTRAIAKAIGEKGKLMSIDLDPAALENAARLIKQDNLKNVILVSGNFRDIKSLVLNNFKDPILFDGLVLDLGLSSFHLADESRGFSFKNDGPLDMAFGPDAPQNTWEIVNSWPLRELERIIRDYGEEKAWRRIAAAIVLRRKQEKIKSAKDLATIIQEVVRPNPKSQIHPATKTFQALRMATNEELESLERFLPQALELLRPGGRLAIVSFHSLEDRIVKNFFKQESRDCLCPSSLPQCVCGHKASIKIVTKKPISPSLKEVSRNPRARSAKLRVAEKIN